MALMDKKIEEFQVRKPGTNNLPCNDPRAFHNITIRVRRLSGDDMSGAMKALKCGEDPSEFMGKTEYYAIISLAGEPAEIKGSSIESVKAQALRLIKEGPDCTWDDKILIEVEWVLDNEELPEGLREFTARGQRWHHDSLKYRAIRKAHTGMGDYWARAGGTDISAPPKLGKSGGFVGSHERVYNHEVAGVISDTPENRAILERISDVSRLFHCDLGRIVLAGEESWNDFVRRVNEGESIADAARNTAAGIVDKPQQEAQED